MAPTREMSGRDTDIPAAVRCRPDPDGIVVWVPVDEPEPDREPAPGEGELPDRAQVDQG